MAQHDDDLSIRRLFRVIFMQGGQVAVGTAIGAGLVLLFGIIAVFLAPIWLPIFAFVYWRREKKNAEAAANGDAAATVVVDAEVIATPAGPQTLEPGRVEAGPGSV